MIDRVLIVIPALNEEATIANIIELAQKFGDVLVIDDGSIDRTTQISQTAGASVIASSSNFGYEYSLNIGYRYAIKHNYHAMVTIDADGQLPADCIPDFLDALNSGAALAVGRRKYQPRICEKMLAVTSSYLSPVDDLFCGMKAYDINRTFSEHFSTYNSYGTALALEYLKRGELASNIDVIVKKRKDKSRLGGLVRSEFKLLKPMIIGQYFLISIAIRKRRKKNVAT